MAEQELRGAVLFRWNQGRRPGRHWELFAADSPAALREAGAKALAAMEPDPTYPLALQSLRLWRRHDGAVDTIWSQVGSTDWPLRPGVSEEVLARLAGDIWEIACRRLTAAPGASLGLVE